MKPKPGDLGVHPGSRAPANPDEVEMLLRAVPATCFRNELSDCLFSPDLLAQRPTPGELTRLASPQWLSEVIGALARVEGHAEKAENGGLQFLARTLGHFLSVQKLPASDHPLVVGLYLRSYARKDETPDNVEAVRHKMDLWEP